MSDTQIGHSNPNSLLRKIAQHPLATCALLLFAVGPAYSGIPALIPSGRISEDGSRLLVLLPSPKTLKNAEWMRREIEFPTTDDGETIDILEFPHSGLYSLPDRQLIKKIEWFSLGSAVKTSADLVDLVRVNVTGRGGALKFYTNFDEVKSYRVEDLLKHFSHHLFREFTIANYHHRWIGKIDFVSDKVILKTSERQLLGKKLGYWEEYQFDFSTGEIESMKIHAEGLIIRIAVLGTAIVLASCMLVWWFRRRRRTAKQGSSANL